jgi:fructose-1,6-bisphosphatase/inositol monophosphatase family enzyme
LTKEKIKLKFKIMDDKKINDLLLEYLTKTSKEIKKKTLKGEGRKIMGEVINRPEDLEIEIDQVGEKVLENLLKKYKIRAVVFSEGGKIIKSSDEPDFYGALDPFDGSVLYLKGFEHNWYSALSFYDKERKPIVSGVVDILNDNFYLAQRNKNYFLEIKENKRKKVFPQKTNKPKDSLVLASYLMSSRYSSKLIDFFGDFIKRLPPKVLLYPQGGPFIYAYLAKGLVDAYLMFDEPRSEIDPGFPFAKFAGSQIISVKPNGSYQDYEFIPGKQNEKVELLIATSNPKLRDQLIKHYVKEYEKRRAFRP